MPGYSHEPEAFAEQVAALLKRLQPAYKVELTGPRELVINGRRLDSGTIHPTAEDAYRGGLEELRKVLGW
jgi:hypothetical protein